MGYAFCVAGVCIYNYQARGCRAPRHCWSPEHSLHWDATLARSVRKLSTCGLRLPLLPAQKLQMLKRKALQKAKEEGLTNDDSPAKEPLLRPRSPTKAIKIESGAAGAVAAGGVDGSDKRV